MAKRSTKIALTYFITIIAALALAGGATYFMLNHYLTDDSDDHMSAADVTTAASEDEGYVPSVLDNQTTLFILNAEKRSSGTCFVLTRLLPEESRIIIVPIQSDTAASLNGNSGTLYDLLEAGGASTAVHSVEAIFGVSVDKYVCFDKTSFEKFAAMMGSIQYDIPYSLIYENPDNGETTVIRQGIKDLDPVTMRKVLTYPNFKSGETSRISIVGTIITDLVNSAQTTRVPNGMDQVFNTIIDSGAETDISAYDYEFKKDAIIYTAQNSEKAAELMLPSGTYDQNGIFIMDDSFIKSVRTSFSADMFSPDAAPSQAPEPQE